MKVIKELTFANLQTDILDNTLIHVIYFGAVWCDGCKMYYPVIQELASSDLSNTQVWKVDVDESPDLCQKFSVSSIPVVYVVKDKKIRYEESGYRQLSYLKQIIQNTKNY